MKESLTSYLQLTFKNLAKYVLAKNPDIEIIGVTGSVGKSSTKEAIYTVLSKSKRFENKVKKSEGNLNNELGLPLAILGFKVCPSTWLWPFVLISALARAYLVNPLAQTSILILEYAADKPGDINYLTSIAKPKIAVITCIGASHTQYFGSISNVAREKGNLAFALDKNGVLFLNKSDQYSPKIAQKTKAKVRYFSNGSLEADKNIAQEVGKYYHLPKNEIELGLKNIKPLAGRLNVTKGKNQTIIIDDTYNANPLSMKRALEYLQNYKVRGRRIALLGDMLELGSLEKQSHLEVTQLAKKNSDIFIAVGLKFQKTKPKIWFFDSEEAANYLLKNMKKNDIILIKGSHAMKMDRIVEKLKIKD